MAPVEDFKCVAVVRGEFLDFQPLLALPISPFDRSPRHGTSGYGLLLGRQPLHFLLADQLDASQTIMAKVLTLVTISESPRLRKKVSYDRDAWER
jgi:hypothetical protein